MAYISGSITEDAKIIVLDSNHNKIVSKDFTPDSYTKLLLHFDESVLVDSCATPKILTLNGGVARSATKSKFGGYAGYFDGVDDYITIPDSADWYFPAGTNFTVDFWINFVVVKTGRNNIIEQTDQVSQYWNINYDTGNLKLITSRFTDINAAWTPSPNTWYHIALVRSGTTYSFYVNGSYIGGRSESTALNDVNGKIFMLWQENAYIDEFRISKGIARWTSNFTPPAQAYKTPAPFMYNLNGADRYSYSINNLTSTSGTVIAVSNEGEIAGYQTTSYISDVDSYTKLLLHFNESPLTDTIGKTLTLNGSVARSAIQSKFGEYSGYFDGNGDYITLADSNDWNFGINDFTIDLWAYFTNFNNTYGLVSHAASGTTVNSNWSFFYSQTNGLHFSIREGGTFRVDIEQGSPTAGWVANTWYHLAAVRNGSAFNIYRNGISLGSDTWSGTMASYAVPLNIGIARKTDGLITQEFYGYMDELRISKGIARWTSNFTPPTIAYI